MIILEITWIFKWNMHSYLINNNFVRINYIPIICMNTIMSYLFIILFCFLKSKKKKKNRFWFKLLLEKKKRVIVFGESLWIIYNHEPIRRIIPTYKYTIYIYIYIIYVLCVLCSSNGYYNIFVSIAVCIQYVFWLSLGWRVGVCWGTYTPIPPLAHSSTQSDHRPDRDYTSTDSAFTAANTGSHARWHGHATISIEPIYNKR